MIVAQIENGRKDFLGGKGRQAVITRPAYFNDDSAKPPKQAGEIAGRE